MNVPSKCSAVHCSRHSIISPRKREALKEDKNAINVSAITDTSPLKNTWSTRDENLFIFAIPFCAECIENHYRDI